MALSNRRRGLEVPPLQPPARDRPRVTTSTASATCRLGKTEAASEDEQVSRNALQQEPASTEAPREMASIQGPFACCFQADMWASFDSAALVSDTEAPQPGEGSADEPVQDPTLGNCRPCSRFQHLRHLAACCEARFADCSEKFRYEAPSYDCFGTLWSILLSWTGPT